MSSYISILVVWSSHLRLTLGSLNSSPNATISLAHLAPRISGEALRMGDNIIFSPITSAFGIENQTPVLRVRNSQFHVWAWLGQSPIIARLWAASGREECHKSAMAALSITSRLHLEFLFGPSSYHYHLAGRLAKLHPVPPQVLTAVHILGRSC